MRICFIGDGNSVHVQRWVSWFSEANEVKLISTTSPAVAAGYETVDLPSEVAARFRLVEWWRVVRRVIAHFNPDVLHSHYINEAGWLGAASGRRPHVVTAWGSDIYRAPRESLAARVLNPWAVRRADWVTCDSQDQIRELTSWGVDPDRLSLIGWGVDLREFNSGVDGGSFRETLQIPPAARVVLSPRQWFPNSNVAMIVAAHAQLDEDTYLILKRSAVIHEAEVSLVESAIASSSGRERIRIVDRLEASELPALYATADVVVSLCLTDGTPVSVLEAMALGRPVVALRNPSVAEWVSPPGGTLVSSPDPGEVARAVRCHLRDGADRQQAALHNVAVVRARADRSAEFARMAEIYERVAPVRPREFA